MKLPLPNCAVDAHTVDSLLFYLGEAMAEDTEGRNTLITQSGMLDNLLGSASPTAVRIAIQWNFPGLLRAAVSESKLDINASLPPDQRVTPLSLACSLDKSDMVKLVLDLKADPLASDGLATQRFAAVMSTLSLCFFSWCFVN